MPGSGDSSELQHLGKQPRRQATSPSSIMRSSAFLPKSSLSLQATCFLPKTSSPCLVHLTSWMLPVLSQNLSGARATVCAVPSSPFLLNKQFIMHTKSRNNCFLKATYYAEVQELPLVNCSDLQDGHFRRSNVTISLHDQEQRLECSQDTSSL